MKKVMCIILSVLLFSINSNVFAFNENEVNDSYEKLISYYEDQSISYLDEIIAFKNANLDVSKMSLDEEFCEYDKNQDFKSLSAGMLAKFIIASICMGDNPEDINGNNLISILTSYINENYEIEECINDADDFVWVIFALYIVEYEHVEKLCDTLIKYQIKEDTSNDRDNDKGAFNGAWGVSMDIAGLCLEALTLVNKDKYQANIDLILSYLNRKQDENAGYDPNDIWGYTPPNSDTQASVLEGLLVYDKQGVISGKYDKNKTVEEVILKYQNQDGSFINGGWDQDSVEANPISTYTVLRSFSTYKNGSFALNLKEEYNRNYIWVIIPISLCIGLMFILLKKKGEHHE